MTRVRRTGVVAAAVAAIVDRGERERRRVLLAVVGLGRARVSRADDRAADPRSGDGAGPAADRVRIPRRRTRECGSRSRPSGRSACLRRSARPSGCWSTSRSHWLSRSSCAGATARRVSAGALAGITLVSAYGAGDAPLPGSVRGVRDDPFNTYRLAEPVGYWNTFGSARRRLARFSRSDSSPTRVGELVSLSRGSTVPFSSRRSTSPSHAARGPRSFFGVGASVALDPRRLRFSCPLVRCACRRSPVWSCVAARGSDHCGASAADGHARGHSARRGTRGARCRSLRCSRLVAHSRAPGPGRRAGSPGFDLALAAGAVLRSSLRWLQPVAAALSRSFANASNRRPSAGPTSTTGCSASPATVESRRSTSPGMWAWTPVCRNGRRDIRVPLVRETSEPAGGPRRALPLCGDVRRARDRGSRAPCSWRLLVPIVAAVRAPSSRGSSRRRPVRTSPGSPRAGSTGTGRWSVSR